MFQYLFWKKGAVISFLKDKIKASGRKKSQYVFNLFFDFIIKHKSCDIFKDVLLFSFYMKSFKYLYLLKKKKKVETLIFKCNHYILKIYVLTEFIIGNKRKHHQWLTLLIALIKLLWFSEKCCHKYFKTIVSIYFIIWVYIKNVLIDWKRITKKHFHLTNYNRNDYKHIGSLFFFCYILLNFWDA